MVNRKKKGKYIGMAGALVVHVAIIALLILVGFTPPEPSEEGGVPVMLGEVPDALGAADPSLVKVDVLLHRFLHLRSGFLRHDIHLY